VDVEQHRKAAIARAVDGDGKSAVELRRAAFANKDLPATVSALVDKVVNHAYRITDEDLAAAKQHFSEDEIFELVLCAAYGQADRQLAAARAAIAEVG